MARWLGRRIRIAAEADILGRARQTRVVLAAAHRDHDTSNNADANLAAFCQRCHMIHDRPEHQRRRWRTCSGGRRWGTCSVGLRLACGFKPVLLPGLPGSALTGCHRLSRPVANQTKALRELRSWHRPPE